MKNFYKLALLLVLTTAGFLGAAPSALAELSIIPTRVLFEDRDRFEEVILLNTGDETRTYDMSWEFFRMIEGSSKSMQERVDGPITDFDLSEYVVFTPRRVTLPPKGRQKIRLALRRPGEVPIGDYRAYLRFSPVFEQVSQEDPIQGQSAAVNFRYRFAIPVIFQSGDLDVVAKIQNMTFERNEKNGKLLAKINISRSGVHSALGHLFVYDGQGDVIGEISNAHVYSEVGNREMKVLLSTENLSGQTVTVEYRHYDKDKNIVFDRREFPVQ